MRCPHLKTASYLLTVGTCGLSLTCTLRERNLCLCVRVHVCVCMSAHACVCVHVHACACVYECTCVCMHICALCVHVCMSARVCACVRVYAYECVLMGIELRVLCILHKHSTTHSPCSSIKSMTRWGLHIMSPTPNCFSKSPAPTPSQWEACSKQDWGAHTFSPR